MEFPYFDLPEWINPIGFWFVAGLFGCILLLLIVNCFYVICVACQRRFNHQQINYVEPIRYIAREAWKH